MRSGSRERREGERDEEWIEGEERDEEWIEGEERGGGR